MTTRRAFLQTGAAAAGGALLVGFHIPDVAAAAANTPQAAPFAPNAFIRIDRQGTVTLIMPQVEMGQGIYTAIAMILAEELDARWEQVKVEHAPPSDKLYANPVFGIQATGGSTSIRAFWTPLRKAGATTRAMLIETAARRWKVGPDTCHAANSTVTQQPSGRTLTYAVLVDDASRLSPPANIAPKNPSEFTLIGKPLKRVDTPDKVNGKVVYGIDAMPPGLKFAALDLKWDEGPNAHVSSDTVWQQIRASSQQAGAVAKTEGDLAKGLGTGARLDAAYELPFLAHAQMEPLNCTVHVKPDSCEVWVGSQVLARAQAVAAKVTGLPLEKVTVHNHLIGGGFGRRLEVDMVELAVRIATKVDGPVKVTWSREEDMQHDVYRPVYHHTLAASVSDGRIVGWSHRITGASIIARWLPPAFQKGVDIDAVDAGADMPYDIPNIQVEYRRDEPPAVPTGFWRGVGPNSNVFAIESFIDELARKAGKDPVAFRRDNLGKTPRLIAAIDLAASKAGWGTPLPPRTGRGIAAQGAFGSYIATVAEVEVGDDGRVKVKRLVSAVDTGIVVNPDTVVAQLQGGLIFGLTAALFGEITIKNGRVQQSNYNDYRVLRINEIPQIEVHLIQSGEVPGGIGETGTTAAPPAVGNAIYAATGVRLRRLPIDPLLLQRKS